MELNSTGYLLSNGSNGTSLIDDAVGHHYTDTTPALGRAVRDIVLPVVCAVGIAGILLTIVVLSRKSMNTSTNCYLLALATADLLFLLLFCTRLLETHFRQGSPRYYTFEIYATYATIVMNALLLTSIWITVILAVERYIAICRPFLASKLCSPHRARVVVVIIFVCCAICRAPNLWLHRVERVYDSSTNTSLVFIHDSALARDSNYYAIYPWIVDVMITSVIPFVLLLTLNACLIWQVRRSTAYLQRHLLVGAKRSEASTVQRREELQVTTMLISVILVFFLCQAPYVIYTALVSTRHFESLPSLIVFRYAAMLLLTLKSALNFLMYCWFSEKFWATFKRVFHVERCLRRLALRPRLDTGASTTTGVGGGLYYDRKRLSSSGNTRMTCLDTF